MFNDYNPSTNLPNQPNEVEEKQAVEQEVDPQTNATLTKLTPGPDAAGPTHIRTQDGALVRKASPGDFNHNG